MTKQLTRERLIQAALTLFKEKGYAAASTRDIAQQAGVNHLTLFRHFGNKRNLFRESVIQHVASGDFTSAIEGKLSGNLQEDLALIAQAYLEENLEKDGVFWLYFNEAKQDPEVAELVAEIPRKLHDFLASYFSQLHDRGSISSGNFQLLARMFFGLLNQYILFRKLPAFDVTADENTDAFIHECVDLFRTKLEKKELS
ncbi:TetR/AcrR family transcriptional regulator [Bacillus glycinifermentans]|uniref:TetR/AcrR family transcriptional regulator n=1 Tax=Bacillus glycinifermentans TaxID=1664069 RepID=UPI001FF6AB2C|nr:TetR/AcrR family transcriptional regulator [Bacillus glycinifermentans]MEC3606417.1 TetR/AcrR family transcriptional regulator [Bacillus glycinifermentans]UOY88371.1 TetR/AcrR family transcriptional regulator [Bacillus glycinifermentans]